MIPCRREPREFTHVERDPAFRGAAERPDLRRKCVALRARRWISLRQESDLRECSGTRGSTRLSILAGKHALVAELPGVASILSRAITGREDSAVRGQSIRNRGS